MWTTQCVYKIESMNETLDMIFFFLSKLNVRKSSYPECKVLGNLPCSSLWTEDQKVYIWDSFYVTTQGSAVYGEDPLKVCPIQSTACHSKHLT